MTKQEKYDKLISEIEEYAIDPYINAKEAAEKVAQKNGFTSRDLHTIIQFMTGKTFLDYIKERKMMAACEYLISNPNSSIDNAIAISGSADNPTFTKKFKKQFGMPPKDALKNKETLKEKIEEPETWDKSSKNEHLTLRKIETIQNNLDTIWGIPKSQYNKIIEIQELSVLYDFNLTLSNLAYEFSVKHDISLKESFEYFDGIRSYGEDFELNFYDFNEFNVMRYVEKKYKCPDIQYLYFEKNFKINVAIKTIDRIREDFKKEELDITKLNMALIDTFTETDNISFKVYKDIFEYYEKNTNDSYDDLNFDEYLDLIGQGKTKEDALAGIVPGSDFNIIDNSPDPYLDSYYDFDLDQIEEEWNQKDIIWDDDENKLN